MHYGLKRRPTPPPEYAPPPRRRPRKVRTQLLTKQQRQVDGARRLAQDPAVLEKVQEMLAAALRDSAKPKTAGVRGSMIFEREYAAHQLEVQERREREEEASEREARRAARAKARYERARRKLKAGIAERAAGREALKEQIAQAEAAQREEALGSRASEGRAAFVPVPTRASSLKDETCRRMLEARNVEARREKLNSDLQRSKEQAHTKKLQEVLLRLGTIGHGRGIADKQKMKMNADQRAWKRRVRFFDKKMEMGPSLLERVGGDEAFLDTPDTLTQPDAIVA
jgi:hypothetical protein